MSMFTNATGNDFINCNFIAQNQLESITVPGTAALEKLEKVASPSAFHSYFGRPEPSRCYPNTRVKRLDGLKNWSLGLESPDFPIKWLNGGAGAGKSAVAQSLAELCEDEGLIVASFFFFRPDNTRNRADNLVATLAYQIARGDSAVRAAMDPIIQSDPHIIYQDIQKQISSLIIKPLLMAAQTSATEKNTRHCLVIIDGLDECIAGGQAQAGIVRDISNALRAAGSQMRKILPRFLICSRPEEPITEVFRSPPLHGMFGNVQLVHDVDAEEDIRTYLEAQFDKIKSTHRRKDLLPTPWPSPVELLILCYKSSGHFIYPRVVINVISADPRPAIILQSILGLCASPQRIRDPLVELDELFRFVLSRATEHVSLTTIRLVLGFLSIPNTVGHSHHPDVLESFFQLEEGDMDTLISDVSSLVSLQPGPGPILLHQSFSDFIFDKSRAGTFHIYANEIQEYIWIRSCKIISQALHCSDEENLSQVVDTSDFVIGCLSHSIRDTTAGPELRAALSGVPLRDFSVFLSKRYDSAEIEIIHCMQYYLFLLRAVKDGTKFEQELSDMLPVVRNLLASAKYDYLIPALLFARAPCRRLEEVLEKYPIYILGILTGILDLPLKPFWSSLIMAKLRTDWRAYIPILAVMMHNPTIGEDYCLTAERYAQASILWIGRALTNSRFFWDPCRNICFPKPFPKHIMIITESRRRYNTPFLWRLVRRSIQPFKRGGGRKHFVETLPPVIISKNLVGITWDGGQVFYEYYRWLIFRFILSRIPALLKHAAKSDNLAALRFKAFAPLIVCFPKRAKRARLAMEAYAEKHGYIDETVLGDF